MPILGRLAVVLVLAGVTATPAPARPRPVPPRPIEPDASAARPEPAFLASPAETTWFGGTHWDPVDQRWEANVNGVWTFDSGLASAINTDPLKKPVGYHSLLEGWTSRQSYTIEMATNWQRFRRYRRTEFPPDQVCVGSESPPLGGDWSLWAGLTQAEADTACYLAGQGYGNWWYVEVQHDFAFTGGNVVLSFDYRCEMDADYGYVSLNAYSDSLNFYTGSSLWSSGGSSSGHVSLTLHPGAELPPVSGPVRFALTVSTGDVSDENGLHSTRCGAFGIDNLQMTGGVSYFTDFESDAGGWAPPPPPPYPRLDFADIRAVDTLPTEPAAVGCSFGDSVLTLIAPNAVRNQSHPCPQENIVLSPWIDLAEAGIQENQGFVFQAGGAYDLKPPSYLALQLGAQAYPDTCQISGVVRLGDFQWQSTANYFNTPACSSVPGIWTRSLSSLIGGRVQEFRTAVSLFNLASYYLCDIWNDSYINSTPWLDNIRVGVIHAATSGVGPGPVASGPAGVTAVTPNPWSGASPLAIRYRTTDAAASSGPAARIDVFDLTGRLVRTLDAPDTRGAEGEIAWDGRDAGGRAVPGGIYFVRLGSGAALASSRKLVVLR